MDNETKRAGVRERYAEIARAGSSCCGGGSCCCGSDQGSISTNLGYSAVELGGLPDGADLGLGCGNPTAIAGIKQGETVVDLGSGAGIDCFLAARRVGSSGRVIGVDMTPDMISRARTNADKAGYTNVDFRLGEIEHLPVADATVDLVISNCVINLSVDKPSVFSEIHRVLKPGGRLVVSDIVLDGELPDAVKDNAEAYSQCIAGAIDRGRYLEIIRDAGFAEIKVESESPFSADLVVQAGDEEVSVPKGVIVSISVAARKN